MFVLSAKHCSDPHEVFDDCASVCERTCQNNRNFNPADVQTMRCRECYPRCMCAEGSIYDRNLVRCTPIAECTCRYHGKMFRPGDSRKSDCNTW